MRSDSVEIPPGTVPPDPTRRVRRPRGRSRERPREEFEDPARRKEQGQQEPEGPRPDSANDPATGPASPLGKNDKQGRRLDLLV